MQIKLVLKGKVPAKKNQWAIAKGGKRMFQSEEVNNYNEAALWQIKSQHPGLNTYDRILELKVYIEFYIQKRITQRDLDGMVATIYDMLEKAEIIANDAQIFKSSEIKIRTDADDYTQITILPMT